MRIFVGLEIPNDIVQEMAAWQLSHERLPVRFVAERNLHVTLLPPWETEDVAGEISKFQAAQNLPGPLSFKFREVTYGPDQGTPKYIWAIGETPFEIDRILKGLELVLGRKRDSRHYKFHATMARLHPEDFPRLHRCPPSLEASAGQCAKYYGQARFPQKKLREAVDWSGLAERVALFESHLLPGGAEYEILAENILASGVV